MDLEGVLREQVVPVLGCTEPGAIGLAAALARAAAAGTLPVWLGGPGTSFVPESTGLTVRVAVDGNVYKNAFAVGLPRSSGRAGIDLAAALGALLTPEPGLNLFSSLKAEHLRQAEALVAGGRVAATLASEGPSPYIRAEVECDGHIGCAVISGGHAQVELVTRDGVPVFTQPAAAAACPDRHLRGAGALGLGTLMGSVTALTPPMVAFLLEGVELNRAAAAHGRQAGAGLGVSSRLERAAACGWLGTDLPFRAETLTAAACDARMAGEDVPVMSCAGSGNQGIVATLPIAAAADWLRDAGRPASDLAVAQAVALSHLVCCYVTAHTGYLTPLCGCITKAGLGAAAGVCRLLGGGTAEIEESLKIMAANVVGAICDGAKVGCALKLATAAGTAVKSALLALEGLRVPAGNGIVGTDAASTIANIARAAQAARDVDAAVLEILQATRAPA